MFLRNDLRSWMSFSFSMPLLFEPSMTPMMPRPCWVWAMTTSSGFAVAANMLQTSGTAFTLSRTLMG